ncbi:MAG: hypothetical protein H6709_21440 [Kofleriaceae bacterium]|nr:hypothetical protein [Myxococcales bacterium]MCB9574649.1 hypothetical protein [Kofleriaceae bacterium]
MRAFLLVAVLAPLAACSAKLGGELTINGEKVGMSSCRNGVVYGYRGVELTAKNGVRVRIAASQTGEANVVMMAKGAATGTELGRCGSFTVSDQNSTINNVKNVEGKAELDCSADGVSLKGSVSFENCH